MSCPLRSLFRPPGSVGPTFGKLFLGALLLTGAPPPASAEEEEEERRRTFTAEDLTAEQRALITRPSPERPPRLVHGERLVYEIGWSWFEVGEAVLTLVEADFNGQPAWRMDLTARTNGFADSFYKVRNSTRSWFTRSVSGLLHYEAIQREGSREREIAVKIDPEAWTAQHINRLKGEAQDPISILEGTWDPLSITYFVRSLPLAEGDSYFIPTTNGKNLYLTRVEVKKRQTRKFKAGRQEAFLLEPDIEDLGGVFRRSKNASIRFWFAANERQFPLRMESEVAVGKFWAELVRVETLTADELEALTPPAPEDTASTLASPPGAVR
jgi:hypothetical protein